MHSNIALIFKKMINPRVGFLFLGIFAIVSLAWVIGGMIGVEDYGVLPLALVVGLLGALLIFRFPLIGMATMCFLVPLGPTTRLIGGERALTLAVGGLLFGIFVSRVLVFREKIKLDYISKIVFAYILWGFLSALWAYDPARSFNYGIRLLQMLAIYVLFLNYCQDKRQLDILTLSFIGGALVSSAVAFFGGMTYRTTQRITLSEFDPNNFALILCLAFILISYYFYRTRVAVFKLIFFLGAMIIGYTIIQAQSRGMWVAISLSLILSLILVFKNSQVIKRAFIATIILAGVIISGYYLGVINETVVSRFQTLFSDDVSTMTARRSDIWKVGLEMIKSNFLLGVGLKNFEVVYNYYALSTNILTAGFSRDPHNTFLGVIAETGIVGFFIFACMFIYIYRNIHRIANPLAYFVYTWLFLCFVLGNFSITNHFKFYFWIVLVLISLKLRLENQASLTVYKDKLL
ncbi:hypothetical protein HRbin37_02064 [bacterium HR37]|nr:hypothetical protein HRbin37_02064 [bacterium HR37]